MRQWNQLKTAVKGVVAFVRVSQDLDRLEEVFEMAESIDDDTIAGESVDVLASTPEGKRAFAERPRVGRLDLAALRALPRGTLGREFAEHMIANKLDPAALPTLAADDDGSFIRAHFYETHDIFHVVTGYATDVPGELGLQAFYLAQGPARLSALILAAGMLNLVVQPGQFETRDARMRAIAHGWLLGRRARPLFGLRWNEMWSRRLSDVRAELAIDTAGIDALVGSVEPAGSAPVARVAVDAVANSFAA